MKDMTLLILSATESSPLGKIILAIGALICFHFSDEGFPPKIWAKAVEDVNTKINIKYLQRVNIYFNYE